MTSTTPAELETMIQTIASAHEYANASGAFVPLSDVKIKWQRSSTREWIVLDVADYLADVPKGILEDLIEAIFRRMESREGEWTEATVQYLNSDDFAQRIQGRWLNRHRTELDSTGRIAQALDRLPGLDLPTGTAIVWGRCNTADRSTLARAIVLNRDLKEAPDNVLDLLLVMGAAALRYPVPTDPSVIQDAIKEALSRYPYRDEAENWLRENFKEAKV